MAGNFFSKLFTPQPSRYLLELKKISASESVRHSIQTHLMGLGVGIDAIDQVQTSIALANRFASASGVPAEDILQLAALGDLDDVIQYIEENGVSSVSQWLQERDDDTEQDRGDIEIDHEHLRDAATAILEKTFHVPPECWRMGFSHTKPIDLLFFNELHEISLSEELLAKHPEAQQYLEIFPTDFVRKKFQEANSNAEFASYRVAFHELLARFPADQRLYVHRCAVYDMHCSLMSRDFGDMYMGMQSECRGLTKEAERFLEENGDA